MITAVSVGPPWGGEARLADYPAAGARHAWDQCPRDGLGARWVILCREALTGSAHQVKGHDRHGPRHQETTMPKYLLLKHYRGGPEPHRPVPPMDQWLSLIHISEPTRRS